jgi:hypothetical protein
MPMRVFFCVALVAVTSGCSGSVTKVDEEYDAELARETLIAALDAWKAGNLQALVTLPSPIRFADDDLIAGFRLVDYQLDQPSAKTRPFRGVTVTLTLCQDNGQSVIRMVQYQIALLPRRAVLRSDP